MVSPLALAYMCVVWLVTSGSFLFLGLITVGFSLSYKYPELRHFCTTYSSFVVKSMWKRDFFKELIQSKDCQVKFRGACWNEHWEAWQTVMLRSAPSQYFRWLFANIFSEYLPIFSVIICPFTSFFAMLVRVFQKWHFVKKKYCNTSAHPSGVYINQIQKLFSVGQG